MFSLDGRVFLDIRVDNNPIPDSFNLISSVLLTEGSSTLFPACKIIFNDLSGNLTDSLNLTDGNALSITSGKSIDDVSTVTRQYRVFGIRSSISPAGPQLTVVGIYDAPSFTTASVREAIEGTSTQVLQKVATACLLDYDGPNVTTHDSQVWLNVCRNRATFVQDVARHGYIDQYSGMYCTLTSLGVLKYKDLLQVMEATPEYTLFHNVPPDNPQGRSYLVKQAKDSSKAGVMNAWQNYGSTKTIHSLSGIDEIEDKLDVKSSGSYLSINQQVSDTVKRARVDASPLDCGNVHTKYERALYQNVRLLGLFVERVSVLITEATDMQLLDTVYYRQADADLTKSAEPTDVYLVIGKSVYIRGSASYAERLELIRMSVTRKGKATLETQDPASLREASTPESYTNTNVTTAAGTAQLVQLVTSLFAGIGNPTRAAFGALSQMGPLIGASSMQLSGLTNLMSTGITKHPDLVMTALQLVNTPSGYLSANVTSMSSNYSSIDQNLGQAVSQVQQLPLAQRNSIYRSGLQQASLFSPAGAIPAIAMALPMLKSLAQISSVYSSIRNNLSSNHTVLVAANPLIEQHITDFNSHADNIAEQYANMSESTNNIWNKSVSITNNTPIPADLYNYSNNTVVLDDLATSALETPAGGRAKVTGLSTTVNSMSNMFQTTDSSGKLLWMYPPSPIAKTYRYSPSDLPAALNVMNNDGERLSLITRENTLGG